jgi:hypothetical protein
MLNCLYSNFKTSNSDNKFENWVHDRFNNLSTNSNNKGVNIEIRCQKGTDGWKFHDRFLIFPGSKYEAPRVWSMGSSINSIGNNHSILMEIKNAQNVLDAFNALWGELSHSVIWKYPK